MAERPSITELAQAIADGADVDWATAESGAPSDAERAVIRRLQGIGHLADHRRRPSVAPVMTTRQAAADPPTELWQWGPLSILEKIGEGAFGEVYRAHDPRLARDVALKLLREASADRESAPDAIEEGRLLARVRHPNVVTVYGADRVDGRTGIWMELLHGRTLEQVLQEHGPFSATDAALIGIDLARALSAVHAAGLVHRDVKAQNIIREDGGRLVLMDFGTGREELGSRSRAIENLTGTPLYLAPEVLDGQPTTAQSDVYSLGVLLYHVLTGGYPVTAGNLRELAEAHRNHASRQLQEVRADLPEPLVAAIERATRPDPSTRFRDPTEMAAALAHALPHTAPSPRFAKRRALLITGLALGIAVADIVWRNVDARTGIERVTTTSSDAARLYNDSYQLGYRGEWDTALVLVKQAVAAAPDFALAHTWQAWCLRNTKAPSNEVIAEGKRALELSSRASEWERLWVEASYDRFTGETEKEIAALRALLKLRPDHYWALNNLDGRLADLGREREATPYLVQRANLRLDYGPPINRVAGALMRVGETDRAFEFARWGRAQVNQHGWYSGASLLWTMQAEAQLDRGDVVGAAAGFDDVKGESVRLGAEARDDFAKTLVLLNLSIGRRRAAAEAADLAASPNLRHFNRATAAFHGGDLASFRSEMSLVTSETVAGDSRVFYLVEAGQLDGAEWELDHGIGVQMNPDAVQVERAKIAMARGNRDLALSLLLAAHPPPTGTLKFELLARLCLEQGDRAGAIAVLEESLNHRARPDLAHWWMRNELQLAELYHEAGRDADARPLEEEMDKLLTAADPDFPLLVRLKALESETPPKLFPALPRT